MNTVTAMLLTIVGGSYNKDANYQIALTILRLMHDPAHLNLSYVAKASLTSSSSVNKFCRQLGFGNFAEMKALIMSGLRVREEQIAYRSRLFDEKEVLARLNTLSSAPFDPARFRESAMDLVQAMAASQEIVLMGAAYPLALSMNLQEDLNTFGKVAYGHPLSLSVHYDDIGQDCLVILLSMTGRLYEFLKKEFDGLCRHCHHIYIVSGFQGYPHYESIHGILPIPLNDDREDGNQMFVEVFYYLKYLYYMHYVRRM